MTNRKRRLHEFLVDLVVWVTKTRSAIVRLHRSLTMSQTLIHNITNTRDDTVEEVPLSEAM